MAAFDKKSRVKRGLLAEAKRRRVEQARQNAIIRRAEAEARSGTTIEEAKRRARMNMTLRTAAATGRESSSKFRNMYTHRTHPTSRLLPSALESLSGVKGARALSMAGKPGHHGTSMKQLSSRPASLVHQFLTGSRRAPVSLGALSRPAGVKLSPAETNLHKLEALYNAIPSPRVRSLNRQTKRKRKPKRSA
jgi:hypothetical protein